MTDWKILYTQTSENDLGDIYEYIAFGLKEPEIAKRLIHRIRDDILSLKQMPKRNPFYEFYAPLQNTLRTIRTGNYISFYRVNDKLHTVTVIRIMYGGRNTEKHLLHE